MQGNSNILFGYLFCLCFIRHRRRSFYIPYFLHKQKQDAVASCFYLAESQVFTLPCGTAHARFTVDSRLGRRLPRVHLTFSELPPRFITLGRALGFVPIRVQIPICSNKNQYGALYQYSVLIWRRARDLNPRYAHHVHTISSRNRMAL